VELALSIFYGQFLWCFKPTPYFPLNSSLDQFRGFLIVVSFILKDNEEYLTKAIVVPYAEEPVI